MAAPTGNQNAKKAKLWEQAVKRALARLSGESVDKGLDRLADQMVKAADGGEQWALLEIGNRLDGKPAQSLELSGEVTNRTVTELSDDALASIAAGSSEGAAETTSSPQEPAGVH